MKRANNINNKKVEHRKAESLSGGNTVTKRIKNGARRRHPKKEKKKMNLTGKV